MNKLKLSKKSIIAIAVAAAVLLALFFLFRDKIGPIDIPDIPDGELSNLIDIIVDTGDDGAKPGSTETPPDNTSAPGTVDSGDLTSKPDDTTKKPADTTQKPADTTQKPVETTKKPVETTSVPEMKIDKNGVYTSKEDVALYIHTYGKLPSNFITKAAAEKAGWSGSGSDALDNYPGTKNKCIGGDTFGNYEGVLPKKSGRTWKECDIDTLNKKQRGVKRIVFSNDGLIYYTEDHYTTFTQLY